MHFFSSFPRFYISFISGALPVAVLGTSGKRVTCFIIVFFFFVSALVPFFCLYFFFLSRGKGEPARSSNATATSCCSLPIQPSSVQHPLFESRRIEHKAPSFCLFSLTPGLAASLHQHNISSAVFLTHNLECSTPPHLHSLLYLMSSSTHCMGDVWFSTHFKP